MPSSLVQSILAASSVTLWRWRKRGDLPEPPLKNRYPLSWLLDLMASRTPGGQSAVNLGTRLVLSIARARGISFVKVVTLTGLERPLLIAVERGNIDLLPNQTERLRTGLGLSTIDLYRLGRVAQVIEVVRVA